MIMTRCARMGKKVVPQNHPRQRCHIHTRDLHIAYFFLDFCPENNKVSSARHLGLRRKFRGSVVPHSRSLSSIYIFAVRCGSGATGRLPSLPQSQYEYLSRLSLPLLALCSYAGGRSGDQRAVGMLALLYLTLKHDWSTVMQLGSEALANLPW
jgi:hypothetical protein